jgi:hypothetical protein
VSPRREGARAREREGGCAPRSALHPARARAETAPLELGTWGGRGSREEGGQPLPEPLLTPALGAADLGVRA